MLSIIIKAKKAKKLKNKQYHQLLLIENILYSSIYKNDKAK